MNREHDYYIECSTLKRKIKDRDEFLAHKLRESSSYKAKVKIETTKSKLLSSLIKRYEENLRLLHKTGSVNRITKYKIKLNLVERYIKRYLCDLNPPLRLEESDDQTGHVSGCEECRKGIRDAEEKYANFSPSLNREKLIEVRDSFNSSCWEVIQIYHKVIKDEKKRLMNVFEDFDE